MIRIPGSPVAAGRAITAAKTRLAPARRSTFETSIIVAPVDIRLSTMQTVFPRTLGFGQGGTYQRGTPKQPFTFSNRAARVVSPSC